MSFEFRGNDRRLMKKAVQVLKAIITRDAIAQGTKKSSAISTRSLMLDPNPPGTGAHLVAANDLITHFESDLNELR